MRRGKKYDVLGMNPENAPPPMPDRNDRVNSHAYDVSGFCTAMAQPINGNSSSSVVSVTSLRVPRMGGSTIQVNRSSPADRPGSATNQ